MAAMICFVIAGTEPSSRYRAANGYKTTDCLDVRFTTNSYHVFRTRAAAVFIDPPRGPCVTVSGFGVIDATVVTGRNRESIASLHDRVYSNSDVTLCVRYYPLQEHLC